MGIKTKNLANLLINIRENEGEHNIQKYCSKYDMEISVMYYRDLEAGRKTPSPDALADLCSGFKFDEGTKKQVYLAYLKDILPADVFEMLFNSTSSEQSRQVALDVIEKNMEHTLAQFRQMRTHC